MLRTGTPRDLWVFSWEGATPTAAVTADDDVVAVFLRLPKRFLGIRFPCKCVFTTALLSSRRRLAPCGDGGGGNPSITYSPLLPVQMCVCVCVCSLLCILVCVCVCETENRREIPLCEFPVLLYLLLRRVIYLYINFYLP